MKSSCFYAVTQNFDVLAVVDNIRFIYLYSHIYVIIIDCRKIDSFIDNTFSILNFWCVCVLLRLYAPYRFKNGCGNCRMPLSLNTLYLPQPYVE